jgi:PKD domain
VLTAAAGETVLGLSDATVEGVDVKLPSANAGIGISASSTTLRDVRVTGPGAAPDPGALGILGKGNMTLDSVQLTGTGEVGAVFAQGNVNVTGLRTSGASEGVFVSDPANVQLSHSKISGATGGLGSRGTTAVTASLLETTAPNGVGVITGDGSLALDHVTVVHRGTVDGTDAAFQGAPAELGGKALLSAVVFSGYTRGLRRDTTGGDALFPIAIRDSVWDPSHDVFLGTPASADVTESNDAHVDPKLVDVANGDYRLRGSSPAIDRDTRTDLRYTDVNGDDLVDGDANGSKLADAGAFEYRRLAPSIETADVAAAGVTGQALSFGATASDPDGDVVQFSWDFGDGSVGAGANTAHTYSAPGIYTVTLHVSDEVGLAATRTFSIAVSAAPATAGSSRGGDVRGGGAAVDTIAPKLSKVRLSKRHNAVLFIVSERAKVRVTVGSVSVVKGVSAGRHSIRLSKAQRRLKGQVTLKVRATDAAGNRSAIRTLKLRIGS